MRKARLNRVLTRMLDETEFLSDYGIRSVSKVHAVHPADGRRAGQREPRRLRARRRHDAALRRQLELARARSGCRSTYLIVVALHRYQTFYGDDFELECPTGSGNKMKLGQIGHEIARRLTHLFLRDKNGRRRHLRRFARRCSRTRISAT